MYQETWWGTVPNRGRKEGCWQPSTASPDGGLWRPRQFSTHIYDVERVWTRREGVGVRYSHLAGHVGARPQKGALLVEICSITKVCARTDLSRFDDVDYV